MRYANSAPKILALSTVSGNASINTLSNTPMPPGTWLNTPVVWAITNRPIYVPNGMSTNGIKQKYSTNPARILSVTPSNICIHAILIDGIWNFIWPILMLFPRNNRVIAKYANNDAAQNINSAFMPIVAPDDRTSRGTRKYPIKTIAAQPKKYVNPEIVSIFTMSPPRIRQRVYRRYRIAPPLTTACPALLLIAKPNIPASIHFHQVTFLLSPT